VAVTHHLLPPEPMPLQWSPSLELRADIDTRLLRAGERDVGYQDLYLRPGRWAWTPLSRAYAWCQSSRIAKILYSRVRDSMVPSAPSSARALCRRSRWCMAEFHDNPMSAGWWVIGETAVSWSEKTRLVSRASSPVPERVVWQPWNCTRYRFWGSWSVWHRYFSMAVRSRLE